MFMVVAIEPTLSMYCVPVGIMIDYNTPVIVFYSVFDSQYRIFQC